MKISKLKFKDHPILKDLELNLVNTDTGKPYDTILFAGENGTGKTSILANLSNFFNGKALGDIELIGYTIEDKHYQAIKAEQQGWPDFFYSVNDDSGQFIRHVTNDGKNITNDIDMDAVDLRRFGCVFSKARADYKTDIIQYATTKQLDQEITDVDDNDNFTTLKQLIVDIENQDYADYAEINRTAGNSPIDWETFFKTSRMSRFKTAFDSFFPKLKYYRTIDSNNTKTILFKKNNIDISIDQLSTGEKQIVFRGIQLLKNSKKLDNAVIMIDEPELSMHPKWEKNILNYYLDLFRDKDTYVQTSQIFIASHSEYVLQHALNDRDNILIIVLKEDNGKVEPRKIDMPLTLPSPTSAEVNYLVFDIISNDFHTQLYGYLQNKYNLLSVKSCDTYIKSSPYYNTAIHSLATSHQSTQYDTLCTAIRNQIHHPSVTTSYTEEQKRQSIELLI